jgi:hypothetical protein
VADQYRPQARVEVVLGDGDRLVDGQPRAPEQHDQRPQTGAVDPSPAWRMTATISSTVGGSGG